MVTYTKPQQRKKERKGLEERGRRSSLLILDVKERKLYDSGKEEERKKLLKSHVLRINDDLSDK